MAVDYITSLSKNGLTDWLYQRATAIVLALYTIFFAGFLIGSPEITYATWSHLFAATWFKVFTLATVISVAVHSWVGMWGILTDYVKPNGLRLLLQMLVIFVCLIITLWCLLILWGA
ncbi:succinate dehydrogenase, hydrophobic membrane anchor protein [Pelagibaculum spongiae]|uniref:Succinate dehydrogenase hydrophobic membrane anchor subunit n=1 Tax=Pelagibaculum spongiae TaxID=2080658 RepID=A0A2V1GV77_9GAMM|nr:succinate dehydrogenase, hydrophobic membrane anchor protein [Pelagibaculum spongiae]PVZ69591.1 succinate dehydrogenase, hydrophobic membrane anchor protein [Pelagibaculum spongiae]